MWQNRIREEYFDNEHLKGNRGVQRFYFNKWTRYFLGSPQASKAEDNTNSLGICFIWRYSKDKSWPLGSMWRWKTLGCTKERSSTIDFQGQRRSWYKNLTGRGEPFSWWEVASMHRTSHFKAEQDCTAWWSYFKYWCRDREDCAGDSLVDVFSLYRSDHCSQAKYNSGFR